MKSWDEKWAGIESKLQTCIAECRTCVRSAQVCKDSIEAVMADLWSLKDWLEADATTSLTRQDIHDFFETPGAFNIRACGDLETVTKHARADDKRRNDSVITLETKPARDGQPLVYSAKRTYRAHPGNADVWEDAVELALRARDEWAIFLHGLGLLPEPALKRLTSLETPPGGSTSTGPGITG